MASFPNGGGGGDSVGDDDDDEELFVRPVNPPSGGSKGAHSPGLALHIPAQSPQTWEVGGTRQRSQVQRLRSSELAYTGRSPTSNPASPRSQISPRPLDGSATKA